MWFFLRRQEQFQRNPDSYNGAVRENYTWSQDYTDLELKVPVPTHVVKGRQVTGSPSRSTRAQVSPAHTHPSAPLAGVSLPLLSLPVCVDAPELRF